MKTAIAIIVIVYLVIGLLFAIIGVVQIKKDSEFNFLIEGNPQNALYVTLVIVFSIFGWLGMVLAVDFNETEGD